MDTQMIRRLKGDFTVAKGALTEEPISVIMFSMPEKLITGYKDDISPAGERLTEKPTPITLYVTLRVRSLSGGASYIAIGDENEQPFRLTSINASIDCAWIDDISKIVAVTDAGTGCLEWIGG